MTSWNHLTEQQRDRATRILSPQELDAYKLALGGAGYWRISQALGISKETARDRIRRAYRKLQEEPAA